MKALPAHRPRPAAESKRQTGCLICGTPCRKWVKSYHLHKKRKGETYKKI